MITLEDALPVRNVILDLEAADKMSAVIKVAHLLKSDARVIDWKTFYTALIQREGQGCTTLGGGLAIPHARGEFVREMVVAMCRLKEPLAAADGPIRYVIVVAVPVWMAADYLRLVGALARVFRIGGVQAGLDAATSAAGLVSFLAAKVR